MSSIPERLASVLQSLLSYQANEVSERSQSHISLLASSHLPAATSFVMTLFQVLIKFPCNV